MAGFDFIDDKDLRTTLENSIEYIYAIYEESRVENRKELYREETYRVIVLYIASVIEAIMMFLFKKRGGRVESQEYKFVSSLSEKYRHSDRTNSPVVIAVQEKFDKNENQISLRDLVTFFRRENFIKKKTAEEMLELIEVRNTVHLSKPRLKKCDVDRVESALSLLVRTIENAPKVLKVEKS